MRGRNVRVAAGAAFGLLLAGGAAAQARPLASAPEGPRLEARSETFLRVFQRALLPGPNGAIVDTHTQLPIHEYLYLRASADGPAGAGPLDAEVAVWGGWLWGEEPVRRFDGDVTTAFVQQRLGPAYLRLGRQSFGSAAAQYVRFDGARAGTAILPELGLDAYAGWTVLPRWSSRPGYQQLGSARDGLVQDPAAIADVGRGGWFVAGGRVHYDTGRAAAGISFHDERQLHELARRNLGVDLKLRPLESITLSASSTVSTEDWQLVDARAWLDVTPSPAWLISAEYLHADPALLLSRQSVLSVFGSSAFDELGAAVTYRPLRHVTLSGSAYAQLPEGESPGMRSLARLWTTLDEAERWRLQVAHTRLQAAENGYHSLRVALGYDISSRWSSSADVYWYQYDEAILGRRFSLVQAANLSYRTASAFSVLWGVSLVQSPYATADLQSVVRLRQELDAP